MTMIQQTLRPYTGVGSRETPTGVLAQIQELAETLAHAGFTLRSGGAEGADSAFEQGARRVTADRLEIFLPWKEFNGNPSTKFTVHQAAMNLAATVHPTWAQLPESWQKLHARNCYQVLGLDLETPSEFLVAWTADGCETELDRSRATGGTGTAIALAHRCNIPVFNLARAGSPARLEDFLKRHGVPRTKGLASFDQPSLFD